MKKTIEELAWDYVASIAGTDPNTDISLFEDDYNAFIAGANAVKNNVDLADVVGQSEQLKAFQKMVNETKGYTAISDELIDKYLDSL